jgi:hypothetical protein
VGTFWVKRRQSFIDKLRRSTPAPQKPTHSCEQSPSQALRLIERACLIKDIPHSCRFDFGRGLAGWPVHLPLTNMDEADTYENSRCARLSHGSSAPLKQTRPLTPLEGAGACQGKPSPPLGIPRHARNKHADVDAKGILSKYK